MKRSRFSLIATLACGLVANGLLAETPRAPARLASLDDFDYFQVPVLESSPNDSVLSERQPPVPEGENYLVTGGADGQELAASIGACDSNGPCGRCEPWYLFPEFGDGWTIDGWINGGATANADPTVNRFNGPIGLNDRREAQLNQLFVSLGRDLRPGNCGWDWAARMDLLYGSDYFLTQSSGLELNQNATTSWNGSRFYGLAMPQLYGEVAYNRLSLKAGHFNAFHGYESFRPVDNFFYSHSYGFMFAGPFTHTGGLLTYQLNDGWTLYGGLVNGWNKVDAVSDKLAVILGFKYTSDRYSVKYTLISGEEDGALPPIQGPRTLSALVFRYCLTNDWEYGFEQLTGWQQNANGLGGQDAEWYNVNQYLLYTINDCWRAGLRAEWFRDDDGVRMIGTPLRNTVFGVPPVLTPAQAAGNYYNVALGVNWLPNANVTVRPEIRWDWSDSTTGQVFDTFTKDSQFTTAVDAIVTF